MRRASLSLVACMLAGCSGPFTMLPAPLDDGGPDEASVQSEALAPEAAADDAPSTDARAHIQHEAGAEASEDAAPDGPIAPDAPVVADAGDGGIDAPAEAAHADGCATVEHADGLGQSWADCVPLATYTEAEATAACTAGYGTGLSCTPHTCGTGTSGDPAFHAVCGSVVCWAYDGPFVGMVTLPVSGGCPRSGASMAAWQ